MSEHAAGSIKKPIALAREHLSNAVIGGAFLMLTGFTPEHWIVEILHAIHLPPGFFRSLSFGLDPRFLVVLFGVAVIVGDSLLRSRSIKSRAETAGMVVQAPTGAVQTAISAPPALPEPPVNCSVAVSKYERGH